MKLLNAYHLKIIALITMLIDHMGELFFRDYEILRVIGRVSFILYAFMLVEGTRHTKNFEKYLGKLLLWAFLSEVPFDFALTGQFISWNNQNVFFTLFFSASGIYLLERYKEDYYKILIPSICMLLAVITRSDYDLFGVAVIFAFYFSKNIEQKIMSVSVLNLVYGYYLSAVQVFGILGLFPIYLYNGEQGKKTGNVFYSFYAVHLLILGLVKYYLLEYAGYVLKTLQLISKLIKFFI